MRIIDADKYQKELLSAYDDVSMEFEVLDRQPLVSAILIPEGTTNGDVIKAMFPNVNFGTLAQDDVIVNKDYSNNDEPQVFIPIRVWNAPYKGDYNLSEKPTGSESEDK